ncbi:MAG: 50S ribosomal protein L30e [Candidatus Aenigmatarchaeota archaeon]
MARKKSESKKDVVQAVVSENVAKADAILEDLKAAVAKGNALFGSRSVMKALKLKSPKMIFVASNCPESAKNDINSSAKISGTKIENFEGTGKQLGVFCGKPFSIASLAVLEEQKKK